MDDHHQMTRTELGYAYWKEDPKMVAAARVQAKGAIAQRHLWRVFVESWARPTEEWLSRVLERKGHR